MAFFKGLYSNRSWGQRLLLFFMIWLLFYFVFNLIGGFLLLIVTGAEGMDNLEAISNNPEYSSALKYFQLVISIGIFVIPPLVFAILATTDPYEFLKIKHWPNVMLTILAILIIFSASPLIYSLLNINQSIHFPEALSGLEQTLRNMEERNNTLIERMLEMDSPADLLLNLTVIAVIPALGEELLFRGGIQQLLYKWTKKPHLAIILAGAFFSFIHFQFFGFLPRMVLGILFGYLLYWSGSLWLPILAHFVHNASQVIMVYMHDTNAIEMDVKEVEGIPIPIVILSVILLTILLALFYKLAHNSKRIT